MAIGTPKHLYVNLEDSISESTSVNSTYASRSIKLIKCDNKSYDQMFLKDSEHSPSVCIYGRDPVSKRLSGKHIIIDYEANWRGYRIQRYCKPRYGTFI